MKKIQERMGREYTRRDNLYNLILINSYLRMDLIHSLRDICILGNMDILLCGKVIMNQRSPKEFKQKLIPWTMSLERLVV